MKAVLMSIQPKWCKLIASGKKTVEVRKTRPKLEKPFKCYIYCTQGDSLNYLKRFAHSESNKFWIDNKAFGCNVARANGKVIGEFVCDEIEMVDKIYSRDLVQENSKIRNIIQNACIEAYDLLVYLGYDTKNKKPCYAWHISDLVIYDEPKELSEFRKICQSDYCHTCDYAVKKNGYLVDCDRIVKRPPQSWCYVEERSNR